MSFPVSKVKVRVLVKIIVRNVKHISLISKVLYLLDISAMFSYFFLSKKLSSHIYILKKIQHHLPCIIYLQVLCLKRYCKRAKIVSPVILYYKSKAQCILVLNKCVVLQFKKKIGAVHAFLLIQEEKCCRVAEQN